VIDAVFEVEGELAEQGVDAKDWSWTLTWLEGRPVAELDTGVIVSLDAQGQAVVRHDVDDEFAG
jgi:hypothetical protein